MLTRTESPAWFALYTRHQHEKSVAQALPAFLQTQVDVLQSEDLAWQTIRELKLDRNPAFNPEASGSGAEPAEPAETLETRLIQAFKSALHVDLVTGSRMINVSFESPDPRLAA